MDLQFSGPVWQWRGPSPYYFVSVPDDQGDALRSLVRTLSSGWGAVRVSAQVGGTVWRTSLTSKDGRYVLPLKDLVRRAEAIADGDTITVRLLLLEPPTRGTLPRTAEPPDPAGHPASSDPPLRPGRDMPAEGHGDPDGRRAQAPSTTAHQLTGDRFAVVPANGATWVDLQAVFGTRGDRSRCWCQQFKMLPRESWSSVGAEELAGRLRQQTGCGDPEAARTSGLVAYLDGDPVGWCAVEPRTAYLRMVRNNRVPWDGRTEEKTDDSVWALTCFITRAGFRRRGVSRALALAAVDFARQRGARALEGYPDLVDPGTHVGSPSLFLAAGFIEVNRPTNRRAVMRIDF